jgi:CheY-like chemotaxis protein/two-component sensor histidine kinase
MISANSNLNRYKHLLILFLFLLWLPVYGAERTPLNAMIGWIQLLRGNLQDGKNGVDPAHSLNVIERNARAQTELISDILFVSRVVTGKLQLNFESVDLISVIESAIDVMRPSIEAKEIRLFTDFDSAPEQIKGDADRLQQIFWNLLSNAVKFTPSRGTIEIRVRRKNSNIIIKVIDSGQGIEEEFLPYVFDRFRQADNSTTRKIGGLGLGLAIVRYLVELHGGSIKAESRGTDFGAAFTLTLPIYAQTQPEESQLFFHTGKNGYDQPQKSAEAFMQRKISVVLVEDDTDSRDMLKILLEQNGIETVAVDSASEALEIVKQTRPDILISDVGLPDEDGYDLIRKIRSLPLEEGGGTRAIALTGFVSTQDRSLALSAGFDEHLAKPLDIEKLLYVVRELSARQSIK